MSWSVKSSNPEQLAIGVANHSGFSNLADIDVRNFQGAQDTIKMVDAAINEISSSRGDLGAFQKNTLESNLSNLRIANERFEPRLTPSQRPVRGLGLHV